MSKDEFRFLILFFIWFFLMVFCLREACADENLRFVIVRQGDCSTMAEGWKCYDQKSWEKLDAAQKSGIDCLINLKKEEEKTARLSKNFKVYAEPEWYQKPWIQLTIGTVLGLGLGLGIGATY